jgi:hypothetical protein
MKLYQLKELFTQIFSIPANAVNARRVMKEHNISIVRHDFRCTKTWEMLMNCFDAFKELVELAKQFVQRVNNPTPVVEEEDYSDWIPCPIIDVDPDCWWEKKRYDDNEESA